MENLARPFSHEGRGFVVGVLLDARRGVGFVAALNMREHLLITYCFSRRDLPLVTVWEENRAVTVAPWKRRTQTRSLEFGTTLIAASRREMFVEGGPLFGVPTATFVPAHGTRVVRYVAFLAHLPAGFDKIRDVELGDKEFLIVDGKHKGPVRVPASNAPLSRSPL